MVLQREFSVPIFGTATPEGQVSVALSNGPSVLFEVSTLCDEDGTWELKLPPQSASGPFEITVSCGTNTLWFEDVYFGEVWIASGQSNMEWIQQLADDYEEALIDISPTIRMFTVEKVSSEHPVADVRGQWEVASPDTIAKFSAVAFAFAKQIRAYLKVPIGIIHASWGGSPAESWMSPEGLSSDEMFLPIKLRYEESVRNLPVTKPLFEQEFKAFFEPREDFSIRESATEWSSEPIDLEDWRPVEVPVMVEALEGEGADGAFWFRKTFDVPAEFASQEFELSLGIIQDFDECFINGIRVGGISTEVDTWLMPPRRYRVEHEIIKPGQNSLAIRIFNKVYGGGFTGESAQIALNSREISIPLAGTWMYRAEHIIDPKGFPPAEPVGPGHPWCPSGLYHAMIAPIIPYAIRGAIWYQGESNADRAFQYRSLFAALIKDWRRKWQQGDFPFLFVQLANYMQSQENPVEDDWAELREAQSMALSLPNTGMAVTIDIGNANDIHPRNKREVGNRLALNALNFTYGFSEVVPSGPIFRSAEFENGTAIVSFETYGAGLSTSDQMAPVGFSIAGEDRKFFWANAQIQDHRVVLTAPEVAVPVAVRYGWSHNPIVNLTNRHGLPASPFRSDDWPGITYDKR